MLHPVLQAMLDKTVDSPPMESFTPEQIRATDNARFAAVPRPAVALVEDRMIKGPRGEIRIRIYRPAMTDGLPVITFFHGSGFVICSIDTHDGLCRALALRANAIVVSVDYALAPENPFPAGPDDAFAAVQWVSANAAAFGGDPSKQVVAGDSAGATMSIVSAMRARNAEGPNIAAQILIYPVTEYPDPGQPSYTEHGTGCGLTAAGMRWFWDHYLSNTADKSHPFVSPLHADNLFDLPPAYIMIAEYDVLRDEGLLFAERLKAAAIDVTVAHYYDVNHGFMSWVGLLDRADEALDAACDWLKARL